MKFIFLLTITALLLIPIITYAQDDELSFDNPVKTLRGETPQTLIGTVIKVILGLVGVVALVFFISAGFTWMTAQGNAEKIKKAQGIMMWAAIGLIVIFASYAILTLVFNIIPK